MKVMEGCQRVGSMAPVQALVLSYAPGPLDTPMIQDLIKDPRFKRLVVLQFDNVLKLLTSFTKERERFETISTELNVADSIKKTDPNISSESGQGWIAET